MGTSDLPSSSLETIAESLVDHGKGILAADESLPTIGKRFDALSIASSEESRRAYRETLFTTPGLGEYISGAILFEETLRQTDRAGTPLVTVLQRQGIIPGIKVDLGTSDLANFPGEKVTGGLDGLRKRLTEYRRLGARFTKWRAVFTVSDDLPTPTGIAINAQGLAQFATLSQESNLVPIVEPEILMDGDHSINRTEDVANAVLRAVFDALADHRVRLEAMLLKPAMLLPGADCPTQVSDDEVALRTLRCLLRRVPPAVPGVVFLSGGQTPEQATARLTAINRAGAAPWVRTFSFGRALQDPALNAWRGKAENVPAAQVALLDRARQNHAAVTAP